MVTADDLVAWRIGERGLASISGGGVIGADSRYSICSTRIISGCASRKALELEFRMNCLVTPFVLAWPLHEEELPDPFILRIALV